MTFERVAATGDIPEGRGKAFLVGGTPVAVFNSGGTFYAMHAVCPHAEGPMAEGYLEGTTVSCPWHGWQFDLETGARVQDPSMRVACFPVKVEGDGIYVGTASA